MSLQASKRGGVMQNAIGPVRLWMSPFNIAWAVIWAVIAIIIITMFSITLMAFGVPVGVVVVLALLYMGLIQFLKLVCTASSALPSDEMVAKLKAVGFQQKANGNLVLSFIGIPSSRVQVVVEGEGCCLRGSRQMLWKAINRLNKG